MTKPRTSCKYDASSTSTIDNCGPLVDSGASYSAIRIVELVFVTAIILPKWNGTLESIPVALYGCQFWQYGVCDYASEPLRIIDSISLPCRCDETTTVWIRYLKLDGGLQWVIHQIVTEYGNICQIGSPQLVLQKHSDEKITFTLLRIYRLFHMRISCFWIVGKGTVKTTVKASVCHVWAWSEVQTIIDRVHHHVCGHSDFGDIKTLLQRNKLWSQQAGDYVNQSIACCHGCRSTSLPSLYVKCCFAYLTDTLIK